MMTKKSHSHQLHRALDYEDYGEDRVKGFLEVISEGTVGAGVRFTVDVAETGGCCVRIV